MNKFFLFFFILKLNSNFFDSQGNFIYKEPEVVCEKKQSQSGYINFVLYVSIGLSCLTNCLFYNAIDNQFVEKNLEKNNPNVFLSEIKSNIVVGFFLSIMITGFLVYVYYVYNGSFV